MASRCLNSPWRRPVWLHAPCARPARILSSRQPFSTPKTSSVAKKHMGSPHDRRGGAWLSLASGTRCTHSGSGCASDRYVVGAAQSDEKLSQFPLSGSSTALRVHVGAIDMATGGALWLSGIGRRVGTVSPHCRQGRGLQTAKGEGKRKKAHRGGMLNEAIAAREVLLVWDHPDTGKRDHALTTKSVALRIARVTGLDLVVISPSMDRPVCHIVNHQVESYRRAKAAKLNKKKRTAQLKQIKMKGLIGPHDFERKMTNIRTYLQRGDNVKVTLEASMYLLRRNLSCLDTLEKEVLKNFDPNQVLVVHGEVTNKLAKRVLSCSYKKSAKVGQSKKGAAKTKPTSASNAVVESDTRLEERDASNSIADNGKEDRAGSGADVNARAGADSDVDSTSDSSESDSDSESDSEESESESEEERVDEGKPQNQESDVDARNVPADRADQEDGSRESPAPSRSQLAYQAALAEVARFCEDLKTGKSFELPDLPEIGGFYDDDPGEDVEKQDDKTERGGVWARVVSQKWTPAETEADLLDMKESGAFDGMDDGEIEEYHVERRKKRKMRGKASDSRKDEVGDGLFEDEKRVSKSKGKSKTKKRRNEEDEEDWDFDEDDPRGPRRMRKWEAIEMGIVKPRPPRGAEAERGHGRGRWGGGGEGPTGQRGREDGGPRQHKGGYGDRAGRGGRFDGSLGTRERLDYRETGQPDGGWAAVGGFAGASHLRRGGGMDQANTHSSWQNRDRARDTSLERNRGRQGAHGDISPGYMSLLDSDSASGDRGMDRDEADSSRGLPDRSPGGEKETPRSSSVNSEDEAPSEDYDHEDEDDDDEDDEDDEDDDDEDDEDDEDADEMASGSDEDEEEAEREVNERLASFASKFRTGATGSGQSSGG